MIKVAIIDDEPPAIEILEDYVSSLEDVQLVKSFRDPIKAMESSILSTIDLLFLDINMPRISGLELLRVLPVQPKVIFTTAHHQHALESYNFFTVDYLVKPIAYERFLRAIQKAKQILHNPNKVEANQKIVLKGGSQNFRLEQDKIYFIKALGDFAQVYYENRKILISSTMKVLEESLKTRGFIRVHRSYLVNLTTITSVSSQKVKIKQWDIPIGRTYKEVLYERYFN